MKQQSRFFRPVGIGAAAALRAVAAGLVALSSLSAAPRLLAAVPGPASAVLPEAGVLPQAGPAVASAADGRHVVIWADEQRNQIIARRFDADGAPVDGGVAITDPEPRSLAGARLLVRQPAVAINDAGGFVVAWQTSVHPGFQDFDEPARVWLRRFGADGLPAGPAVAAEAVDSPRHQGRPAIAMQADGHFVLAWTSATVEYRSAIGVLPVGQVELGLPEWRLRGHRILVQRYDAAAQPLGAAFSVATRRDASVLLVGVGRQVGGDVTGVAYRSELDERVAVTIDGDGRYTIGWRGWGDAFVLLPELVRDALWQRRFEADGRPRTAAEVVDAETDIGPPTAFTIHSAPAYARQADGSGQVVWTEARLAPSRGPSSHRLRLRRLTAGGRPDGPVLTINSDAAVSPEPAVAALPDGSLALCWISESNPRALLLQRLRADGSAIDAVPLTVSVTGLRLGDGSGAALAADASGALTVSWSARNPAVDPIRDLVFLRRYPAP